MAKETIAELRGRIDSYADDLYIPLSERKADDNGKVPSGEDTDMSKLETQEKEPEVPDVKVESHKKSEEVSNKRPAVKADIPQVMRDQAEFDAFVENMGVPTLWQKAFICPCIDPVTHQADPTCPICHGTYRGYLPAEKDTMVAIQSQNRSTTRTKQFGNLDLGTAGATFKSDANIDTFDRLTIPSLYTRQNFVFNVNKETLKSGFYIPYEIRDILYIISRNNGQMYEPIENVDYAYKEDTRKIYIFNKKLLGSTISLMLNVTLRYIVWNVDRDTRYQYNPVSHETERLARHAILKKESVLIENIPTATQSDSDLDDKEKQVLANSAGLSREGKRLMELQEQADFGLGDL